MVALAPSVNDGVVNGESVPSPSKSKAFPVAPGGLNELIASSKRSAYSLSDLIVAERHFELLLKFWVVLDNFEE